MANILWPPSSPELNHLDYYIWGIAEPETNKHPHNTISSVKDAITMANMIRKHLIQACGHFHHQIEETIANNVNFIEHIYIKIRVKKYNQISLISICPQISHAPSNTTRSLYILKVLNTNLILPLKIVHIF